MPPPPSTKNSPLYLPSMEAQFEALLIGYDLIDFVTGVKKCLAIDATNSAASKAANSHWVRQDKLILHTILASTSITITHLLAAYKTSHEAWTTLNRLYTGKSRTRAIQFKEDLTLSTRGTRTVTEFLHRIKVIADELAIIDHPVSDDDLTLYILNGLGPEFREIAAPIRAHETSLKFEKIHDLLVGHESYLRQLENQSAATFVPTAHYSHRQGGRMAKNCPKMSSADFTANCAASSQGKNHKWLVDSAASHNMTTDLSNLLINYEYDGTDEVVIGDGSGAILLKGECENGVYPFPEHLPPNFKNVIAYVHECTTPDGWHKRLGHPSSKLCDAIYSELTALMRHNTWQLVPPLNDCNIVGCKWVFLIKRYADGSVDRFKARLVAKGFNPVVKPVTIRTVLTLAVMQG
ncbi:putative mitochondrial protein [Vitis vinifera]|uniref:Putative mitochondrial protein n=1 Tax=Vitis vinifera TaxID=29760 RepID=A0A438GUL7_VITVI|nr:putative mitochondrial protein [Vitis vinifera]